MKLSPSHKVQGLLFQNSMTPSQSFARYIGVHEDPNNTFSDRTEFGKKVHAAGQHDHEAWCAYAAEVAFKDAYPSRFAELDKLFNASAIVTFNNFKKAGYKISLDPVKDALVIWQHYKEGVATWQGHAGIVSEVFPNKEFKSIEGNTNAAGGREGIEVAEKKRAVNYTNIDGLRLLGFVII